MSSSAHRLIVPVLGFGLIVAFASSYYLLGVLAEPLAAGTGTTSSLVFAGLSGAFLISAALSPFGGRWVDRRGGREVLSVASVVFAAGLAGLGLSQGPVSMVASILTLGVGMGVGFYGPAFAVLVAIHAEEAKKPITAVSLILTPARFLQAAAPLSYGVLLDRSAGLALLASSAVCILMFAMTFGLERRA